MYFIIIELLIMCDIILLYFNVFVQYIILCNLFSGRRKAPKMPYSPSINWKLIKIKYLKYILINLSIFIKYRKYVNCFIYMGPRISL